MKTAMQELIEDINIEKKLGYITENTANRILDYINNLYLEKEKEQIRLAFREGHDYWGEITSEDYYNQTYNQKQIIIDIMKADEEDGLYNQNK